MSLPHEDCIPISHKRDTYWDLVKALLIFLVIWGHCIQYLQNAGANLSCSYWESPIFKGVYLFHMPLFMLISGYFAAASIRKHGINALLRYAERLVIPCVVYAAIHMGAEWSLKRPLGHPLKEVSILWFLLVVFESTCLYYLIQRCSGTLWRLLYFILMPIMVLELSAYNPLVFPAASQFTYLWPFFVIGAELNAHGFTVQNIRKKFVVLLILIIPFAIYVPKQIFVYITPLDFSFSALAYDATRTGIALMLCFGFLGMALCIQKLGRYNLLQGIGRSTLALYVLQSMFFAAVKVFKPHYANTLSDTCVFVLALILLLFLYMLYSIIRRISLVSLLLFGEGTHRETHTCKQG